MKKFLLRIQGFPHFLYLLPIFFVFHGYTQNLETVRLDEFFKLTGEYLLASAVLYFLGWLFYRNRKKAALFAFGLLFFHLFFGGFHDLLKKVSADFFLAKYSVLLPLSFVLLVFLFFWLRKTKKEFTRFFAYLNLVLLVLLLVDVPSLFRKKQSPGQTVQFKPCANCNTPDVHFIIADEYADSTSLSQIFGFNNKDFLAELRSRGFHINKSRSNYNYTPFSLAAMLSMDYISGLEGRNQSYADRVKCAMLINQNPVIDFFKQHNYIFRNNSIFQFNNIPTNEPQSHFKIGIDFIASHTFLQRVWRDIGWHLVITFPIKKVQDRFLYSKRNSNQNLVKQFEADLRQKDQPKFVYTHLHIPHFPYYYRHNGQPNPLVNKPDNIYHKPSYVEYLRYGNTVYLDMIDKILKTSARPPIIVLMGDHGYRDFVEPTPADLPYYYMNLNAVYLPNGNYQPFYEGITGVNQFRALLNAAFGQSLPMLNDSTSILKE
jgi:hypothetical protein